MRTAVGTAMDFVQTVAHSFSVQRFLLYVLLFQNMSLSLINGKTLQDTCPSKCICDRSYGFGTMSVACNDLELTEIPTLLSSKSVNSLDVSYNILGEIKEFVFKDYSILENLILSDNAIEQIDSRAFHGLKMLINIDLSYNQLQFIPPAMFSDTPVLQTVSFSGNPLVYVPDSSPLLVSPSVTSVDLSYCDLTSVNRHTFSQLPALQVLDLNSNKLEEFNRDILNTLTEIAVIDFGNNLWKCDCNTVEVLNWLSTRRRSKGLLGEHQPVECVEAGVQKTIWPSTGKNELCSEQAEGLPNTSSLKAPLASSEGLLGEQKPVECVEAGVQKTIWSTLKHELCLEQAKMLPNTSLKAPLASSTSTTDAKVSMDKPTTSELKKEKKDTSMLGSRRGGGVLSLDINTFLVIVFWLILLVTNFMNTVREHGYNNIIKFLWKGKVY